MTKISKPTNVDLSFESDDDNVIYNAAHAFRERSPIRYLVDGMIRKRNLTIWYGGSGQKKTQTALDMAVHVSEGIPWLGRETEKGNVLVFDTENGQDELEDKIAEIVRGELGYESQDGKIFYDPKSDEDVDVVVNVYYISIADINLIRNPELGVVTMIDRILRVQASLFILDSLDGMMVGYSDSEQVNITALLYYLRQVVEATGATPLVLHNTNRSGSFRGSGAIPQGAFNMVQVKSSEGSDLVHIADEKLRRGKKVKLSCECHWEKDEYGDDIFRMTLADPDELFVDMSCTNLEKCVLNYLAGSPNRTAWLGDIKTYAHENGFGQGSVGNVLPALEKRGFTTKRKEGKKAYYAITDEGMAFAGLDTGENES
jgi:DNA-binding transcriptional ArsR family regulator